MATPVTQRASWHPPYSGTPVLRLWRRLARYPAIAFVLVGSLAHGGCALSYRLDSVFGSKEGERKTDVTGSISGGPFAAAGSADLLEADLTYAKTAAADLLARGANDASVPWQNPATGARGTVTPVAAVYELDGHQCRDFLASYLRASTEAWLQGEACRTGPGRWEVRSLKPFNRT